MFVTIFLFVAAMLVSLKSNAIPVCNAGARIKPLRPHKELLHQVAIFGERDDFTEKEWSSMIGRTEKYVHQRYAPTGTLRCKRFALSISLTGSGSVAVTAGHAFIDPEDCSQVHSAGDCKALFRTADGKVVSEDFEINAMGFKCPQIPTKCQDWAVLKLRRPIKGIRPYVIDENERLQAPHRVVAARALMLDHYTVNGGKKSYYKTIGSCPVWRFDDSDECKDQLAYAECDGTTGASGGSILNDDLGSTPVMLGMIIGGRESEEEAKEAREEGKPKVFPYEAGERESFVIPMQGAFRQAVLEAQAK